METWFEVKIRFQSDRGLLDFKNNPKLVKAWIRSGIEWWDKDRKKPTGSRLKFESIYDLFVHNIFFNSYENFRLAKSSYLGKVDCKEFIEKYFKIEL